MTKIIVFDTFEEANKQLQPKLNKNILTFTGIINEGKARAIVYRKSSDYSKRHDTPNEELSVEEIKEICTNSGDGEIISVLFKIYSCEARYGSEESIIDLNKGYLEGPHSEIETIVNKARSRITKLNYSYFGAMVSPLFYTVRERFKFSEEERKGIRDVIGYSVLDNDQKSYFEGLISQYYEESLTNEEIGKFENEYNKFLN